MKKILTLVLIFLGIFFIIRGFWSNQLGPVSNDKITKLFIVQKGESISNIAQRLEKEKLIRSSLLFKVALKMQKNPPHIEAGDFNLSPSMSIPEIITSLSKGSQDIRVTFLEGWRIEEMAKKLSDELGVSSSEFMKAAKEGYMFPDTYLFNKTVSVADIAATLKNTFKQKYSDELQAKIKAKGLSAEEGVILASIVEREGRTDKVRTEVASILLKRLKIGMALNADATLQYILGYQKDEKSWWKRNLTEEDKEINSLYNTYLHAGLPPGPICNPGLSSLTAVANADPSTLYLYYYHDAKGNSHPAKTLEEHNANVINYP